MKICLNLQEVTLPIYNAVNVLQNKNIFLKHWGTIPYQQALDLQTEVFNNTVKTKIANRALPAEGQEPTNNYIFLCEHTSVYTLGKSGKEANLLWNKSQLESNHVDYFHINRGGDITYHGPGPLVAYPILDMDNFFTDIHLYLRLLEEVVIQTLAQFNIDAGRIAGLTGVWLDYKSQINPRKICAFGVKMSRWVTMHGLALNVNTDLEYFKNIIPCGIADKAVTSMKEELGRDLIMGEVENIFISKFESLFDTIILQ